MKATKTLNIKIKHIKNLEGKPFIQKPNTTILYYLENMKMKGVRETMEQTYIK